MIKLPIKKWTAGESAQINEILETPLGVRWLQYIYSLKPKIDPDTTTEKAALKGVYIAGFEHAFDQIAASRIGIARPDNASVPGIDPTKD